MVEHVIGRVVEGGRVATALRPLLGGDDDDFGTAQSASATIASPASRACRTTPSTAACRTKQLLSALCGQHLGRRASAALSGVSSGTSSGTSIAAIAISSAWLSAASLQATPTARADASLAARQTAIRR